MLEYLEKLMQDEDWRAAQRYAEELLRRHDLAEADIARIYYALANARFAARDFDGAAFAGNIVLAITERLQMWDLFGQTCLNLSATYHGMGDITNAEEMVHRLLEKIDHCSERAPWLEATAWFNMGTFHFTSNRHVDAERCFQFSLEAARRRGLTRYAHGVRQAMVETYLQLGLVERVPSLLAHSAHYLRHCDTTVPQYRQSVLFHYLLRIKYAMKTNKLRRARVLALRALTNAVGEPRHQFDFHMQLAQLASRAASIGEAIGHSLAAQVYAAQCNRHDLEREAVTFLHNITVDNPDILSQFRNYYLQP